MLLRKLVDVAATLGPDSPKAVGLTGDAEVRAVVHSTADVGDGALFCCVRGARVDGHELAPAAVRAGAAALLVDHELREIDVPQIVVPDVREAMAGFAAAFWGQPSRQLDVVGVTGTAGKTTVTQLLRSVLEAAGRSCGVIGTLSGARTTPEAPELQALLAAERDAGHDAVAMEVSSHGLELHRVDATRFSVAVFTNLSRDHLDFHHTMDAYFAAKARLFTPAFTDCAVICIDDEWGRRMVEEAGRAGVTVRPYSVAEAEDLELAPDGARFVWQGGQMRTALTGRFNVANAVATATAAQALGVSREAVAAGLRAARPAPGRFEQVDAGQPFTVLVDYAHKPDALEQALLAGRDLTGAGAPAGRMIVLFGCGGDRDPGKRPLMGAVAGRLADRVVVTSDNPRSEDPSSIIAEIRQGIPSDVDVEVEPDRRRAIAMALASARPGDVVLLAGKGHETTQTVGDRVLPFDDRAIAEDVLETAGWTGSETSPSSGRETTTGGDWDQDIA